MGNVKVIFFILIFFSLGTTGSKNILNHEESKVFRAWFVRIIAEQFRKGPSPRWVHRDCAGLVRFAANEAFAKHDDKWLHANGIKQGNLPPDLELSDKRKSIKNNWNQIGQPLGSPYASAITIIQANSQFISRNINDALPGDLIFYDHGADQHLMVWMGSYIAYHTGREAERETGLRAIQLKNLKNWKDSRWWLTEKNPNFVGIFRFSFLPY